MCSPPHVVDMDIHPLRGKLDQGFSPPRIKTVPDVGDKIEASQGNKGATACAGTSLPGGRLVRG
jgi:hypothetical protein